MKKPRYKLGAVLGLIAAALIGSAFTHDNRAWLAFYPVGLLLGLLAARVWAYRAGYRAAFRVEHWRHVATDMRVHDPDTYDKILSSASADVPSDDPDACVALWLAAAADEGVLDGPEDFYGAAGSEVGETAPDGDVKERRGAV